MPKKQPAILSPLHRALHERDYYTAAHIAVYEGMATLSEKEPDACPSPTTSRADEVASPVTATR